MLKKIFYSIISKNLFGLNYYEDILDYIKDRTDFVSRSSSKICRMSKSMKIISEIYSMSPLIFVHIPKNAGISISRVIYNGRVPHFGISTIRNYFAEQIQGKATIAIYRDPIERFASAYRYCRTNGTLDAPLSAITKKKIRKLKSIDDYIFYIKDIEKYTDLDHVFRPQSFYTAVGNDLCCVDHLIDMNNLNKVLEFIPGPTRQNIPMLNIGREKDVVLTRWQRSRVELLYYQDFSLKNMIK